MSVLMTSTTGLMTTSDELNRSVQDGTAQIIRKTDYGNKH
jgi:hypothetical protein